MIIQNTLSNIVGLLDNVMVGRLGPLQIPSVAVVNQLLVVFYLCIWGSLAGAGIFSTFPSPASRSGLSARPLI